MAPVAGAKKEEIPLTIIKDSHPRPQGINFARQRPYDGNWKSGGQCENAAHNILIMGRVTYVKGAQKIRDGMYVCAVCKPTKPAAPAKGIYPPMARHPEATLRLMSQGELTAILHGNPRVPPWWPGPEPRAPEGGSPAERGAYSVAHRDWVRWSRQCWQARCQLVALHQRHADGSGPRESEALGYEA